jgi:hypothetical protein
VTGHRERRASERVDVLARSKNAEQRESREWRLAPTARLETALTARWMIDGMS